MSQIPADWAPFIVDRVDIGLFVLDREHRLLLWNQFMEKHSGRKCEDVAGQNLYDCFPELPRKWLEKKINSVFILRNFAFTSWEQRPYLFQFAHNRPITGGIDFMQQNTTIMPVLGANGEVEAVCISLFDATDTAIYQRQLNEALVALEESNNRDGLTGIFNRRHLQERLSAEFERARRYDESFALIMFDLDHFKKINDNFGHLGGDAVLRTVGKRMSELLRKSDIFGRYGGEEFMLVLPGTDVVGALTLAERIRHCAEEAPADWDGTPIPFTISMGISIYQPSHQKPEDLIHETDLALYFSKKNGRNQATRFDPAVHTDIG